MRIKNVRQKAIRYVTRWERWYQRYKAKQIKNHQKVLYFRR